MQAPAQFGVYFAVLRKHLILLGVSASLVVAAGVFYVLRQQPVFLAKATLLIETPQRNLASGGDYAAALAAEGDELQTQVEMLKLTSGLAQQAVEKLKAAGVNVAAGEYDETNLPARVKVEPVPGTRLVTFSLTGPDRASLPLAVDKYAEVFQEWSADKSASRTKLQEKEYQRAVDDADAKLKELRTAIEDFAAQNKTVDLRAAESADSIALREQQALVPGLEGDREADTQALDAIRIALAAAGVEARTDGDHVVLAAREEATPLETRLAEDERVVALPCVQGNSEVQKRLNRWSDAELLERKVQDLKEDRPERIQAAQQVRETRARAGKAIAGAIQSELNAIEARRRRYEATTGRIRDLALREAKVRELKREYDRMQASIDDQLRVLDRATTALKGFQTTLLHSPEVPDKAALATRIIRIVKPAGPAEQIAPKVPLIIGLTAFAAIAAGLGLVLLFEYLDDTIKSREDFDRYVGLPFLGFIPRIESKDAEKPDLAADARSGTAIAEAFRAVRTSILFSRSDKPVRSILVTSAGPGEGKTTVATNLAITLAKHKGPVLLVDADLRRPRVAKALGIENRIGLTNYLVGEATLEQVVQKTSVEGLFAVTSGPLPPNPAELLHGDRLAEMLKTALLHYDRVVIDSPPVIAVSDARVIARCTDGLYLVISMGKTSWRLIQRSLESLTSIGFEVHGAILNNLSAPTGRYGYYYYRDYNYGKGDYVAQSPAAEK